jgi:hypothetical protein
MHHGGDKTHDMELGGEAGGICHDNDEAQDMEVDGEVACIYSSRCDL